MERDVPFFRHADGELLARVYQPQGPGPFPALLDVHGGAWNLGDRLQNELVDTALAASGIVVVAVDFRLAPHHPYPAQVQDVNLATRWLKVHAGEFNASSERLGGLGSSSGGHTVALSALRPRDPRYAALPLPEAPGADAGLAYLLLLWGVLDPLVRYRYAQPLRDGNLPGTVPHLARYSEDYFLTEEAMVEGNPQMILERGEPVDLPPALVLQGFPDSNVPKSIPERFVEAYRVRGGSIEIAWFPGSPHGFMRDPGPPTDRGVALAKAFIARQLAAVSAGA
jgi:acetyl esterase/lipase